VSKHVGPVHWRCDRCGHLGPEVDANEVLPYQWLSLDVLPGIPQLRSEAARRSTVHLCEGCARDWLFSVLTVASDDVERLRSLWQRLPEPRP